MRKPRSDGPSPAEQITNAIIERLEAGVKPWVRPWNGGRVSRPLRWNGIPYQGVNTFWLWLVGDARGYASPHWMTYRQCAELGGQVRRGERSQFAIFYKAYTRTVDDRDSGGERDETRRVLRAYPVFNADQTDGLPARFAPTAPPLPSAAERSQELEAIFDAIGANTRHTGDRAYYEPVVDRITMPPITAFTDAESYYAVRAHECAHWSGHGSRLARDLGTRFGSESYAAEELVAEMTSAILGSELGLPVEHLDHHASYIESWLKVLRADSRAILAVAARADEAARYLLRLAGRSAAANDDDEADEELQRAA